MRWTDTAVVLCWRRFGERQRLTTVLGAGHGLWRGISRGGVESGTLAEVSWSARLEDSLGRLDIEPVSTLGYRVRTSLRPLLAWQSAVSLLVSCLPERVPAPATCRALCHLRDCLAGDDWLAAAGRLELILLSELGYGLDLSGCALCPECHDLVYVSPRTGRAVCREHGRPWADRLLPLPPHRPGQSAGDHEVLEGLRTTGHFLSRHLFDGGPLPFARQQFTVTMTTCVSAVPPNVAHVPESGV